jgi:hypothetical protein
MAQAQHLPLYNSAYVFVREIYRIKIRLPKTLRHDLGQQTSESALNLVKYIVLANQSQLKETHISEILLEIETQWVFLRLLFDLRGITEGEFKVLSERLSDIGKQAQAWLNWAQEEQGGSKNYRSSKNNLGSSAHLE